MRCRYFGVEIGTDWVEHNVVPARHADSAGVNNRPRCW